MRKLPAGATVGGVTQAAYLSTAWVTAEAVAGFGCIMPSDE